MIEEKHCVVQPLPSSGDHVKAGRISYVILYISCDNLISNYNARIITIQEPSSSGILRPLQIP